MKKLTFSLFALAACVLLITACKKDVAGDDNSNSTDNTPETKPAIQTAVSTNVNGNIGGFYKALPARYDSSDKKYPLMIFIHGVGELGNGTTDLSKVLSNAVPKLLNQKKFPPQFTVNGKNFSFIVISPQFKAWPAPADVNAMVDWAVKNLRIDTTRIYISGLSMGGGGTWDYAMSYASRIAAIVPVCGATWPTKDQCSNIAKANLPVWAFHNQDDGTVGVGATTTIIDNINSFSPAIAAKKTIWTTGGHDAWSKASNPDTKECDGKNMYEWMLQYTRTSLK
jgi:predicted peptidase